MNQKPTSFVDLRRVIADAGPSTIEAALARSMSRHPGSWGRRQKYLSGSARAGLPKAIVDHPYAAPTVRSLSEYVAASVLLHSSDAWSLLGRAVAAYVHGDTPVALHLLYYSELRAAQSLLARYGVAVFDKNSFVIDLHQKTVPLNGYLYNKGTHGATWDIYSAWSDIWADDLLGEVVRVASTPLSTWMSARPVPIALSSVAPQMLKQWGLELKRMLEDRGLRNAMSYEPTRLILDQRDLSPARARTVLGEIWQLLEPSRPTQFDRLDRFLLRQTLEHAHRSTTATEPSGATYMATTAKLVDNVSPAFGKDLLVGFLQRVDFKIDPTLLGSAGSPVATADASDENFNSVCGRALIMARLATGAAGQLIASAGLDGSDFAFWADDILSHSGIEIDPDGTYLDSWDEVEAALASSVDMLNFPNDRENVLLRRWAAEIETLSATSRVSSWSVSA